MAFSFVIHYKEGNAMKRKMNAKEIVNSFNAALREEQIYPWFQPQVNHSTGRIVGAEALMRWGHPELGLQLPGDFIPVLEERDLIYSADISIFESVCRFLRKCLNGGLHPVPVPVNMSRCDMYYYQYVEEIERIRQEYEIPVRYLRIEITETSAIAGLGLLTSIIEKLHGLGYIVDGHSCPPPEFSRFRHRVRAHPAGLRGYVPRLASPTRVRGKITGRRDSPDQMESTLLHPLYDGIRRSGRTAEGIRFRHDGS